MHTEYDVIVMKDENGEVTFSRQTITNNKIPDIINGESGSHICYVRTLTELIARQLVKLTNKYNLTDEKIEKIALAASLHDVGKSRIPHAILDKKGALTPVEYDIVKKHTLFGSQLLSEAASVPDKDIMAYAEDIARHHHERYDGTGYPDGLVGEDIPIEAQIVSIGDAYEALTAERTYKKALSRDVALGMIANGMCGVFNPLLIECLIHVADHKQLEDIRSSLARSRATHIDEYTLAPKRVLLLGNLRYVTESFIRDTFDGAHVSVVGSCDLKSSANVKIYRMDKPLYKAIFETYDFDLVVYFANELTYDTTDPSDFEELRQILTEARYLARDTKFLYLSSLDGAFTDKTDHAISAVAKEELCVYWAEANKLNLKILRIPYLYNGLAEGDFLHNIFCKMQGDAPIKLKESEGSKTHFMSLYDLSELIVKIIDSWTKGDGILAVSDDFNISFADLTHELLKLKEGVQFNLSGENAPKHLGIRNTAIKKQYNWFSRISVITDLRDEYDAFLATLAPPPDWLEKIKEFLSKHKHIIKLSELVLMFILCEILVQATDSALFFSIVDFRVIYIVLMATLYGLRYGLGAAGLCSLSWMAAKVMSGTSWMTLFYEPTNWLAFIFFFLVGSVTGYVKLRKDDKIKFTNEENRLLEEKLSFTRKIYEDTFNEKRDLKKQIIGSKDSFGKIFDITRQLNTVDSHELYLKIINSFEEILDNKTLSVFSVNEGSHFARLEVASRDIMHNVSRSVSLDTYAPVIDVIKRKEVWRNNGLIPNMPMYACGIFENDRPLLLIFIWNAEMHQRSLYYVNLFRILCDLAQMSLIRAQNYAQAVYDRQYIKGTRIQTTEAYEFNLNSFRELAERKVFRFVQLEIDPCGKSIAEMDAALSRCVRTNDIIGSAADGTVRILLSQSGEEDLKFIMPRFEALGIKARKID